MRGNINIYIVIMASVSAVIRLLPMTLIRKPIKSTFIKSFLFYVPYVTLAVMTFPAIVESAGSAAAGIAALMVGILMAVFGAGLFPVAVGCCATVLIITYLFPV